MRQDNRCILIQEYRNIKRHKSVFLILYQRSLGEECFVSKNCLFPCSNWSFPSTLKRQNANQTSYFVAHQNFTDNNIIPFWQTVASFQEKTDYEPISDFNNSGVMKNSIQRLDQIRLDPYGRIPFENHVGSVKRQVRVHMLPEVHSKCDKYSLYSINN